MAYTIAGRLREILDEIDDIVDCAEDTNRTPVTHKLQEARGAVESALSAAKKADEEEEML